MATYNKILDTLQMIEEDRLDIRTVTMGISLLQCADPNLDRLCKNIFDRVTTQAQNLVQVARDIEGELGIPIVNKRVSVTPIALVAASAAKSAEDMVKVARTLDAAAREVGVDFIGGYSAIVDKDATTADKLLIDSIPQALAQTEYVCSSVSIGSSRSGINMSAVAKMGQVVKQAAEETADRSAIGAAKLVVFCNSVGDNPFMAGAFHGVAEPDVVLSVGVSGPGVVRRALEEGFRSVFWQVCPNYKEGGVPDHSRWPTSWQHGGRSAWGSLRHRRSVARPHRRGRRFGCAHPRRDGRRARGRTRNHRRPRPA